MADRTSKRPAGVTRLPAQPRGRQGEVLETVDLSGFTTTEVQRALVDRGLSPAGADAELRTRLSDSITAAFTAAGEV